MGRSFLRFFLCGLSPTLSVSVRSLTRFAGGEMSDTAQARPLAATLTINNIIVILPVAHLLVASLYTWAWLAGFGANVAVLADPRDLFSVSISQLVTVYVVGLLFPTAQMVLMWKYWDSGRAPQNGEESPASRKFKRLLAFALVVLFTLSLCACFDLRYRGWAQGLAMMLTAQIGGVLVTKFVADHVEFGRATYQLASILIGLLAAAMGFGLSDGNLSRYQTYEGQKDRLARCGEVLVQRRFGENYVGVKPQDRHVVTDLECKVTMTIPPVSGEARREFHWRPYPHVHYVLLKGNAPMHQASQ